MAKYLPNVDWVIGGDFNMVEHHKDWSWFNYCKLSQEEYERWIYCQNIVGVVDPVHNIFFTHATNWFTWSNCRLGNDRKLRKLDPFYISHNLNLEVSSSSSCVLVDYTTTLFDPFLSFVLSLLLKRLSMMSSPTCLILPI